MTNRAGAIFPTADSAAIAAIEDINAISIAQNWEYAGRILQRASGFTFSPPQTLQRRDDSSAGLRTADSVGTYHTHSGEFEPTDERFSPDDLLKATLGKESSYLGTPRGRILKFTPIDLLPPFEQRNYPQGAVATLRAPVYNLAQERGQMLGRWVVDRPATSDQWDAVFFYDGSCLWTQGAGESKFASLGEGVWWTVDDTIAIMWSADLFESWPLPLRPGRQTAAESDGARLVAKKIESPEQNVKARFSLVV
jgi:hypothetical protein